MEAKPACSSSGATSTRGRSRSFRISRRRSGWREAGARGGSARRGLGRIDLDWLGLGRVDLDRLGLGRVDLDRRGSATGIDPAAGLAPSQNVSAERGAGSAERRDSTAGPGPGNGTAFLRAPPFFRQPIPAGDPPSSAAIAASSLPPSGSASAASRSVRRLAAGSGAAAQAARQPIVRSKFRTPRSWVSP